MAVKSSFKNMTLCLLAICLVCSGLLAGVYALTKAPIDAAAKAKNEAAIKEVLPESAVAIDEEGVVEMSGETYTYNLAYDENGDVAGCAVNVKTVGFGGPIVIKVGFDANGVIWNTKVLSQSETPGLGAKCVEPAFADQFRNLDPQEKKYYANHFTGDMEIVSLTGTVSTMGGNYYAHLHMSAGDDKGHVFGGHLNRAVISATCEMVITVIEGQVDRRFNEEVGLNTFDFS